MNRAEEIRSLNALSADKLPSAAGGRLLVLENLEEIHRHFARSIADVVCRNNRAGCRTVLILPYGPTGQYPLLRDMINEEGISLADASFFFMDEYCDDSGRVLDASHPLSFRGSLQWFWDSLDPDLRPAAPGTFQREDGDHECYPLSSGR
ncbi:MAG: hypothetical protein ACRD1R_18105 [Acidobacteriota bacterium]